MKVAREAAEYIYSFFPGLEDKLSVDEYLTERTEKQDALFRKVAPMAGAANLVRHLVCKNCSSYSARARWSRALIAV
jgi:pseudouridine-5'-monophosphatase